MKVTTILFLLLLCCPSYIYSQGNSEAEQKSEQIEIYFDLNSCVIDSKYRNNREALDHLAELLDQLQQDSLVTISEIKINSFASPEGGSRYNERVTQDRTNSIYDYLSQEYSVPDSIISMSHSGIDWAGLAALVEESDMEYRDEVLYVLNNVPEETWRRVNPTDRWQTLVDSRNKHLMDLKYGRPYHYIVKNFYPQLRRGSIITIYFKVELPPIIEPEPEPIIEPEPELEPKPEPEPAPEPESSSLKFAVKTNLLYDLLLTPNIELEIPIGERWSVAGEWIFPWWVTSDNGYALQVLSGQVEGRYWFGDRTDKPQLTGWFATLYAGGGLYDLQWDGNGYQGEFYIASGVGGGYAHTINKSGSLRMEYSLGFGYLRTNYRYYEGMDDNQFLVWQHDGTYRWFGPTKAKVSLVWFINKKIGGGR